MTPDDVVRIFNSPGTATAIALVALLLSVYTLYAGRFASGGSAKKSPARIYSRLTWSSLPGGVKDVATLGSVLVIASAFFVPAFANAVSHVEENVRFGILFLEKEMADGRDARLKVAVEAQSAGSVLAMDAAESTDAGQSSEGEVADGSETKDGAVSEVELQEEEKAVPPASAKTSTVVIKKTSVENALIPQAQESVPPSAVPAPVEVQLPESSDPAPDIVASTLSHYGSFLVPGELMSFSVIVKNAGTADTSASFNSRLFIDENNNGTRDISFAEFETLSLKKGEQETKIWRSAWVQKGGTHRAEVCADTANALFESNERNNCTSVTFTIQSNDASGDLVTENASMLPASPLKGNSVSFFANVRNAGVMKAGGSYAHLRVNGKVLGLYRVSGLLAGESEKVEWKTIWKAEPGEHRYEICADGNEDAFETDEGNNCSVGTFSVAGP